MTQDDHDKNQPRTKRNHNFGSRLDDVPGQGEGSASETLGLGGL